MIKSLCIINLMMLLLFLALPAGADFVGKNDPEVQQVAGAVLDNLLAGYNKGNYAQYAKHFDDTLREAISEKKFLQVRQELMKKLGKFTEKEYLGFLNQKRYTAILWKAKFAATEDDILIKLVLSKRSERTVVVGLFFQ